MQEIQEMWVLSLGWEDPLEEEMASQSGILAWRIPWTEDPVRLWSMGLQRVGQDWMFAHARAHTHTHTHTHIIKSSSRKEKKIRGIFRDEVCRVLQSFWKNLVLNQILEEWRALRREAGKHAGECQGQAAEPNFSLRLCLALGLNRAQGYIVWDKLGGQDKTD